MKVRKPPIMRMPSVRRANPKTRPAGTRRIDGYDLAPVQLPGITAREEEVVGWVAQGLTNKEIASQLHVSARTIQTHLERMFKKLRVRTRTELVAQVYLAIMRKRSDPK